MTKETTYPLTFYKTKTIPVKRNNGDCLVVNKKMQTKKFYCNLFYKRICFNG
jgi:hypothetical protein